MSTHFFDELSRRIAQAVPPSARALQDDFEQSVRAALQRSLAKLDLVTREEYDVQVAVLAKTRLKLEQLEQEVEQLRKLVEANDQG